MQKYFAYLDLGLWWQELRLLLSSVEFYAQGLALCVALAISLLFGTLLRKWFARALPHTYNWQNAGHVTAKLIPPLLTILFIAAFIPLVNNEFGTPTLLIAMSKVAIAWLVAVIVGFAVHRRFLARLLGYSIIFVTLLSISGVLPIIQEYLDSVSLTLGDLRISLLSVAKAVLLMLGLLWLSSSSTRILERQLIRSENVSMSTRDLIVKLTRFFLFFLAIIITLNAAGINLTALAVFGGALGVGIGFGLQKITSNFISGIILLFDKSIKLGDYVQVGVDSGFVREIAVRYSRIETFDGSEIMIPNEEMVISRVINWTASNTLGRGEIIVNVAYDSDLQLVMQLMLDAANECELVTRDPEPAVFVDLYGPYAIQLTLALWVADVSQGRRRMKSDVMIALLGKFRAHGIVIPIPQQETVIRRAPTKPPQGA